MSKLSDAQLLHLISCGDEPKRRAALEALVRRELDFVYAAAVRQANWDRHLAEDITQAVFILLARKAGKLRHDVILRDWLFVTTRYAARNALKIEARRRYHEQRAAAERAHAIDANDVAPMRDRLAPLIDEAVARLSSADRAGVLLSFFDNKTYREVGQTLGVSEEAARKRVGRAIDKMRSFFASRGVTVDSAAAGAVAVSSALRASAGAVPPALANSVLDVALSVPSTSTATSYLLAKGAGKMFIYAKLKLAAGVLAASLIVGGSSIALLAHTNGEKPAAAAEPAPSSNVSIARFEDGMSVELAAIRRLGDEHWWHADGTPSNDACDPPGGSNQPPHSHQVLFKLSNAPADVGLSWGVGPMNSWAHDEATLNGTRIEGGESITFPSDNSDRANVVVLLATGEWESILSADHLDSTTCGGGKRGGVIFSPTINAPNPMNNNQPGALVTVSHDVTKFQYRVLGIDDGGVEHVARAGNSAAANMVHQNLYHFDMPVENLRSVSFQVRPYDRKATFANVTLDPTKKTDVKIKTEKD